MWRPKRVALAGYERTRRTAYGIAATALVLAVLLGLWASRAVTKPILDLVEHARRSGDPPLFEHREEGGQEIRIDA